MATLLGKNAKLYIGSAALTAVYTGTGGPTWTEIGNVQEAPTLNGSKEQAESNTRDNNGWKKRFPGLKDGTYTFTMEARDNDTSLDKLIDAWNDDTEISMAIMDKDITVVGAKGLVSNFYVFDFTRNEPINGPINYEFTVSTSDFSDWFKRAA